MSQHDYDITSADANTGLTMRDAINDALQALASNNSGGTAPGTTYPFMWWPDSANDLLKQRNAANTGWISICTLSTGKILAAALADTATSATSAATAGSATTAGTCTGNAATATTAEACTGNSATATLATTATRSTYQTVVSGTAKNLRASTTGTSAVASVTADEIMVSNAAHDCMVLRSVSITASTALSGAGGLDTGMTTADTWYSVYVIYNPDTSTTAGLISLSATAPTLPSGYTFFTKVWDIRTDSTVNMYPLSTVKCKNKTQYKVAASSNMEALPLMQSGVQGNITTPTYVAVSVATFVPSGAIDIKIAAHGDEHVIMIAPNNGYGAYASATNRPPICINGTTGTTISNVADFVLESTSIYMASNGTTCYLYCIGWEDNL